MSLNEKRFSLCKLAELTQSTLVGDEDHFITGVDSLESAGSEDASFLANLKYKELVSTTQAGVICIGNNIPLPEGKNYLISSDPSRCFQQIIELLIITPYDIPGFEGIHETAIIHKDARIGNNVTIGPYVVIDHGADIGEGTRLDPHVTIGAGVTIGKNCHLMSQAVVREKCILGDRVILQPGAVIGSCGFGYTANPDGSFQKIDQLGIVILEDDVEIGANTTIDRARFKKTLVSQGTKIDNLVQVGHNVQIGKHNIIISQSGIAGSAKTGRNVILGGQAGIVGHLEVADGVMIATRGGVSKSITQPGKYAGGPVMPLAEYNRNQVHLRKITTYVKKIESLEKKLQLLEDKLN